MTTNIDKPLDLTKPVQTRGGQPVRYLGKLESNKTENPLLFAIVDPTNGQEYVGRRKPDGKYEVNDRSLDIINVVERSTRYLAINPKKSLLEHVGVQVRTYETEQDLLLVAPNAGSVVALHYEDDTLVRCEVVR